MWCRCRRLTSFVPSYFISCFCFVITGYMYNCLRNFHLRLNQYICRCQQIISREQKREIANHESFSRNVTPHNIKNPTQNPKIIGLKYDCVTISINSSWSCTLFKELRPSSTSSSLPFTLFNSLELSWYYFHY